VVARAVERLSLFAPLVDDHLQAHERG
jgi:hypothetical protein